jgi:hypothetical protein
MADRYTTASEIKSFAFCRRAWLLEGQGANSTLAIERERGTEDHMSHRQIVRRAARESRAATLLLLLGLAGVAAAALVWWLSR